MNTRQFARQTWTLAVVTAISLPATARAGEGPGRLSTLFARKATEPEKPKNAAPTKTGSLGSTLNWWSIPRPARVAARNLAKAKDASVTRCVAVAQGDTVSYEIHAATRTGLFRKSEFVLTSVSEPRAAAERRKAEQSLSGRLGRIRNAVKPKSSPTPEPPDTSFIAKTF